MRASVLGIILAVSIPISIFGQVDPYQEMTASRVASQLYFEAFVLPGGIDGPLMTVGFRIPNDRLVFMRHTEGLDDKLFRASVSATVELYRDDRLIKEDAWKSESYAVNYDETVDPKKSTVGSVSFNVSPGDYGVRLRLNDLNTERSASTTVRQVTVPAFDATTLGLAVLADTLVTTEVVRYLSAINYGGDARFGEDLTAVVPLSIKSGAEPIVMSLKWTLRQLDNESVKNEMRQRRRQMESFRRRDLDREDLPRMEPPLATEGGAVVDSGRVGFTSFLPIDRVTAADIHQTRITLAEPSDTTHYYLVPIDLNGRSLENGAYVLDLSLDGADEPARSSTRFSTHWPGMPVSLLDIDAAIKNMRFILDKAAVDRLKQGSRDDKINNFKVFWSERDPTPETAYNELMVEYFRRVDYAALEYRTGPGMIPNGLETDRAKVYIVHGPPDGISRSFPEGGGVLETWEYADGKKFTFESTSSIDPFHMVREG